MCIANRFKRLPYLPCLYTEKAEQGSEGLTGTCAAHFKDAAWSGRHFCLPNLKCNSAILQPLMQQPLTCWDLKMCFYQKRDSEMGQTSSLNFPQYWKWRKFVSRHWVAMVRGLWSKSAQAAGLTCCVTLNESLNLHMFHLYMDITTNLSSVTVKTKWMNIFKMPGTVPGNH